MIKKINIFVATLVFMFFTSVNAEIKMGFSLIAGQSDISGTETEGTATDTSDRSKDITEQFIGADIFFEKIMDDGTTYGISLVPLDIEIGSGKRVDTGAGQDVTSEADKHTAEAKASLQNLFTAYTNIPVGAFYALLGVHYTTVETDEKLLTSTYDDVDIFGAQVGFGMRSGNLKYELSYSDFEDINISSTSGNINSITADADALLFKVSYGY